MCVLYKPTFFLLLAALWVMQAQAQVTQIGGDISLPSHLLAADRFGERIALSGDGQRIAIAAPEYDSARGAVVLYEYNGTDWQLLDTLFGAQTGERFGAQVDLSHNGRTLAVSSPDFDGFNGADAGRVQIFTNGFPATTYGSVFDLEGGQSGCHFGAGLALGSDGRRFVVGAPNYRDTRLAPLAAEGIAYLYKCNDVMTVCQLERTFTGQTNGVLVGESVAISADSANILISGGVDHGFVDSTGRTSGARLYQLNTSTNFWEWRQNIYTTMLGEEFGRSLAVSNVAVFDTINLPTVLIGAPAGNVANQQSGSIYITNFGDGTRIENQLRGRAFGDRFGNAVDISADGQQVIVGAPMCDDLASNGGEWRIYSLVGNAWQQTHTQSGLTANGECGAAVSSSESGSRVAVSCAAAGVVRAYEVTPVSVAEIAPLPTALYSPNPATMQVQAQFAQPLPAAATLRIVDATGREVLRQQLTAQSTAADIDCSTLPQGLYFVQVLSAQGAALVQTAKLTKI